MAKTTTDRRKNERLTLLKPVSVQSERGREVGTIEDISKKGMSLLVPHTGSLAKEDRRRYRMHLELYLDVEGTCIWVKSEKNQTRAGIEFHEIDQPSKDLLAVLLGKEGWKL